MISRRSIVKLIAAACIVPAEILCVPRKLPLVIDKEESEFPALCIMQFTIAEPEASKPKVVRWEMSQRDGRLSKWETCL